MSLFFAPRLICGTHNQYHLEKKEERYWYYNRYSSERQQSRVRIECFKAVITKNPIVLEQLDPASLFFCLNN
jgi:hypothetical protein